MGDKGMGGGKQPQKGGGGFGGDKKQAGGAGSKPVQTKPDFKGGGKEVEFGFRGSGTGTKSELR
jgi:hypothetical protein